MSIIRASTIGVRAGQKGWRYPYNIPASTAGAQDGATAPSRATIAADDRKKFVFSCWFKANQNLNGATAMGLLSWDKVTGGAQYKGTIYLSSVGRVGVYEKDITGATDNISVLTDTQYRDPSRWHHVHVTYDSTQVAADRVKIYVDQVRHTTTVNSVTANYQSVLGLNDGDTTMRTHCYYDAGSFLDYEGAICEMYLFNDSTIQPAWTEFGEYKADELSGESSWYPKEYTGSFSSRCGYWKFSATPTGDDSSGNGLDFTDVLDSYLVLDSPTCKSVVMNPSSTLGSIDADWQLCGKKLTTGATNYKGIEGTLTVRALQKYYWEYEITSGSNAMIGFGYPFQSTVATETFPGGDSNGWSWGYYALTGNLYYNGSNAAYGSTYTAGDIIGVQVDLTGGGATGFYKNGVYQGNVTSHPTVQYGIKPLVGDGDASNSSVMTMRTHPDEMTYQPPGTVPLSFCKRSYEENACAVKPVNRAYYETVYVGDGTTTRYLDIIPDEMWWEGGPVMIWVTNLSSSSYGTSVYWADMTGGNSNTYWGYPCYLTSTAVRPGSLPTEGSVYSVSLQNGIRLNKGTGTGANVNYSGNYYLIQMWSNNCDSVPYYENLLGLTGDGTAKQQLVYYSGNGGGARNISHNLGLKPEAMIVKSISGAVSDWYVWHHNMGGNNYLTLNSSNAVANSANIWGGGAHTSTYFQVGTTLNASGSTYLAWIWSTVPGYSYVGFHYGTGDSDGHMVHSSGRPAHHICKCWSGSSTNWIAQNWNYNYYTKYNHGYYHYPNALTALGDAGAVLGEWMDFGVRISTSNGAYNLLNHTYVDWVWNKYPQGRASVL